MAAAIGLAFAAVTVNAQISTINSAKIVPRVYNDAPNAVLTSITNFPDVILYETNVASASGFADKDIWYLSADGGATAYQFQSNDYFSASFNLTLTGGSPGRDLEAGLVFSDPSGNFGGDCSIVVVASGGVVFQAGGPSYYPFSPAAGDYPGAGGSVSNYVTGETYTVGLNYVVDPNTGLNAFQYSVNGQYAASKAGDTYFDLGPGQFVGSAGDSLGAYFQIGTQTVATNLPNSGLAVFQNIAIGSPVIASVPFNIAENGNQSVVYWPPGSTNFVVQTSTNLSSTNWTTITSGTPVVGISVSNTASQGFFRLQYQP